jgi:hypothetical protein
MTRDSVGPRLLCHESDVLVDLKRCRVKDEARKPEPDPAALPLPERADARQDPRLRRRPGTNPSASPAPRLSSAPTRKQEPRPDRAGTHKSPIPSARALSARGWELRESAGINRHGEGDENALHRRRSWSRWPRVMRWRSVRAQRSVDGGRVGGAIEPRNPNEFRVPTSFSGAEGNTAGGVICESLVDPARSENPGTHDELDAREPGDLVVACWLVVMPRPGWFAGWQTIAGWAVRGTPVAVIPWCTTTRSQTGPYYLRNRGTSPGDRGRRWWREGACPRGTRRVKHVPDAVPEKACQASWIVCARWRGRTGMCGSPRSFIT